ncbi:MAG: zinc ribbon domain-containing protein [Desulfovibrionaceae bacterium]|nr:zinc ribbon domain-containing protein [Desulfovibrionaceae bacterium]
MPIYEYCCRNCGKTFEEWGQHFDSPSEETCPECGGVAERIISQTTFKLEGTGWYSTDYAHHAGPTPEKTKADGLPAGVEKKTAGKKTAKPAQSADARAADKAAELEAKRSQPPSKARA